MSKVLLFSDLHVHPHRNDARRVEDGLQCLQWIYDTAEVAKCENVICAGDFMHHRFSLPTYAFSKAVNIVSKAKDKGIKTTFLLGNHDMFYEDEWTINSLSSIRDWATVIDRPTTQYFDSIRFDFLPYTPKPSKYLENFDTIGRKILISHLAVADAVLNSKYDIKSVEDDSKDKEIISASAFKNWYKVWLGHYHFGQKVYDNVEYLGSPMQLSYGEAGQKKHIVVYDLSNLTPTYIENVTSPRFHIVEKVEEIPQQALPNAYVQMRIPAGDIESKFELRKQLSKSGAREIEFAPITVDVKEETSKALTNISAFFHDKNKLIDEYVNKAEVPPQLVVDMLKSIGIELVTSSK